MPVNKTEVTYNLQLSSIVPEFSRLSSDEKEDIKEIVGDYLLEEIENFLDKSSSPVDGAPFKKKKADGEDSTLYDTGDMRSVLEWSSVKGGIKVGIFEKNEAPKAFNHNVGDKLPPRRFIPLPTETFKPSIVKKIKNLVLNAIEDQKES